MQIISIFYNKQFYKEKIKKTVKNSYEYNRIPTMRWNAVALSGFTFADFWSKRSMQVNPKIPMHIFLQLYLDLFT